MKLKISDDLLRTIIIKCNAIEAKGFDSLIGMRIVNLKMI